MQPRSTRCLKSSLSKLPASAKHLPEELRYRSSRCPTVVIQVEKNQSQTRQIPAEFFHGFFQQASFAYSTYSPNI